MKKLLVIGYVWPEPNSSAAGSRMLQLLQFFQSQDFHITFATTATKTPVMADLTALGVSTARIILNHSSFDQFLRALCPDVVLFDRFMMEEQFGWKVAEICPDALRILDMEDLHFLRKAREKSVKSGHEVTPELLQSDLAKREIASIYRCDLSLIISESERELLQEQFAVPEVLLLYLPFMETLLSKEVQEGLANYEQRKHFVSIGNFRHAPNWDAVVYLKQIIWPLIRKKLPSAELHVYGAYPGPKVSQLHREKDGFLIKGWADAVGLPMTAARVLLAPIRFGAGLKGKFIDAMRYGTPSITTPIGAEGMTGNLPWNGKIVQDPREFAMAAIELYSDKAQWKTAQGLGFKRLEENFSRDKFSAILKERLRVLFQSLKKHRQENFTGAMLLHHSLASTQYLSKYIEVKNKMEQGISTKKDRLN